MNFCKRSVVRIAILFCLVVMMWQWMFLQGLNLDVKGEPTSTMYRSIDLYTQKEPHSGRGPNQPSDAFAPQEEVILYAYVTYREDPVPWKIVAFEVHGPLNRFENLSFTQTAVTDANGLANVSFRMTWPNGHREESVFGVWNAIAVVDIATVPVNDTLSFLVGCIVRVAKVETVDSNNVSKTSFMKNERMSFRLTVENIAMTDKIATLLIDAYDNLSVSIGQAVLADRQIFPGVTVMLVQDLLIPQWASLGDGVVYANAYTALPALGGLPWCYDVSTTFSIVKIIAHDVAVLDVKPSVNEVFPCQSVTVSVVVTNEGSVDENFDVSAYYDSELIGTTTVRNLVPQTSKDITFEWDTCCLQPGNYTLSAEASIVPGEIDIKDNRFVNGVVWIKWGEPPPPPPLECVLPKWLLASLFLLAVLFGANLVVTMGFILWWLHKREKKEPVKKQPIPSVKSSMEQKLKSTKTCNVCGREFLGAHTFCTYCMSFHGKDYK